MTQIVMDRVARRESSGAATAPAQSGSSTARPADRPATRPLRTRRPAQGSGRTAGPILRPVEAGPTPQRIPRSVGRAHGCVLPEPGIVVAPAMTADVAPAWRLTDRGIATVLVIAAMITVAALAVVGLTALRVTGEGYQPTAPVSLPR